MTKRSVTIEELKTYIYAGFESDHKIVDYYDKQEKVTSIAEVCENLWYKIHILYDECEYWGIEEDGKPIGYFVSAPELLISFSINTEQRKKEFLIEFWNIITETIGPKFDCMLYSYNIRGVKWLQKCGMSVIFDNVTILTYLENFIEP
jgi:hypothetical protein